MNKESRKAGKGKRDAAPRRGGKEPERAMRFRDYEPELAYGTPHDFQEHTRFGGTRDDY
jgi:hypothetical protein